MDASRREIAVAALTAVLATGMGPRSAQAAAAAAGAGDKVRIAMVLYPGMTALDLVGPLYFLGLISGSEIQLVAGSKAPIMADRGLALVPTHTYDEVPADLDVLFVPGSGPGTIGAMRDDRLIGFLADRGARARYVTSVCTGSCVLGAAGLLKGYRATSHWGVRDVVLPLVGATPVKARIVRDRNRITAGGVSAGLDFGLRLNQAFRGDASAHVAQLIAEYEPEPLFAGGGDPDRNPEARDQVLKMATAAREGMIAAAKDRMKV
jgi:putative intracellular protease/amidase